MKIVKYIILMLILLIKMPNINALQIENILFTSNNDIGTKVVNLNNKNNKNDEKIHHINKIVKIWIENDWIVNATAEIKDNKEEIKVSIYNLLGKELHKIYEGQPKEKDEDGNYKFTSQTPINLPNNVYILVIQGINYKIADKFIVSK